MTDEMDTTAQRRKKAVRTAAILGALWLSAITCFFSSVIFNKLPQCLYTWPRLSIKGDHDSAWSDNRQTAVDRSNRKLGLTLLAVVTVAMFGFGYALVPLYDVFCEITGLGGKTGRVTSECSCWKTQADQDRLVTVEFITNVNAALPWQFRPKVKQVKVHPGKETLVYLRSREQRSFRDNRPCGAQCGAECNGEDT